MAIIVAEYLGKRTDSNEPITPIPHHTPEGLGIQFPQKGICPFNELPCKKMDKKTNARFPVCSLRRNGELYIVCEHRLVSSSRQQGLPLSPYQAKMLLALGREVFHPSLTSEQLRFKTEVVMASGSRADYILAVTPDITTHGPKKLIVEMQGGGETSDTGNMTSHLARWSLSPNPTNAMLTEGISVGLIQTNAWRRLQEQILTKGSVAAASGYGLVACVGTHLFDQVREKVSGLDDLNVTKQGEWDTALIAYHEDLPTSINGRPIPLAIDPNRTVYTSYKELAKRLIERGEPDPGAFAGNWNTITGEVVSENGEPVVYERRIRRSAKKTSPSNSK